MQKTLKNKVECEGIGLHSGENIKMTLCPADTGTGVIFVRTDLEAAENEIPALYNHVVDTRLCTVIANEYGASVGTIEHVMSALRAMEVNNIRIEIDGPEVPIMDGSAEPFVSLIEKGGVEVQNEMLFEIRVLKEISYEEDEKRVSLSPSDVTTFKGVIDFDAPVIGEQEFEVSLLNGNFVHDIARARTFGFQHEVEAMQAAGLARGGSLDNAIVLTDTSVLNKDGLRYEDEFIRHKLLDAIGDLYLAGAPIRGTYTGYKAGHYMNNMLLKTLFSDSRNYELVQTSISTPASTALQEQHISH